MVISLFNSLGVDPFTFMHWALAVSATLFVLDVFFQTDFLSWIALICFCAYFSLLVDDKFAVPIQWSALLFVVFLALAFVFHYALWRKFISPAVVKLFLKNATPEIDERMVGADGIFRAIEGNYFVEWEGQLWSVQSASDLSELQDRQKVKILGKEHGKIVI